MLDGKVVDADRVVSSDSEELILVDQDDNEIGFLDKKRCHDGLGLPHRAFSLFIFNQKGELLLQKRSANKRLWPLFWSNSCCSHPRRGESLRVATQRRLNEELGIETPLEFIYKFAYHAQFGDLGSESEVCSVFIGRSERKVATNPNEIESVRYLSRDQLDDELRTRPEQFTPWFKMEWHRLNTEFETQLNNYSANYSDS